MNILQTLRDMFTPIVPDERGLAPAQLWATGQDTAWWSSLSSADQPVTADTIMQAAVGAALRLLADDISALPLDAYEKRDDESVPIPLPAWLDRPTGQAWDTHTDLISDSVMSLHDGNIFYNCLPNTSDIRYIEVLDPVATIVEQDKQTGARIYRNTEVSGQWLGTDRIVHIPWLRLPGKLRGISPTVALKQSVGSETAARKWSGEFFAHGATLGTIISVPGGPETVDANMLRQQFQSRHSGEGKSWMPAVVTGGATVDNDTISPKDADLGPLFQQAVEVAARFFHIPPHLLASQMAGAVSYASVEQRSIEYVQHAVVPITTRLERVLSRLVMGQDTFVKLNVNGLLRGDATARSEYYRTMAELKVMKPKTIARLEDLSPDEAADGWLETPNNNGIPDRSAPAEEPRSAPLPALVEREMQPIQVDARTNVERTEQHLHLDSVDISEGSAKAIEEAFIGHVDAVRTDMDSRLDAYRSETEEALVQMVRSFGDSMSPLIDRVAQLEEAVQPQPENFHVLARDSLGRPTLIRQTQGSRSVEKRITRDESGHVISIVAA